jgi:hypothetical protein
MVRGLNTRRGKSLSSSPDHSDRIWNPPSLLFNVYRNCFPAVRCLERKVDHSPSSSTELRMSGLTPVLRPYTFMVWKGNISPYLLKKISHNTLCACRNSKLAPPEHKSEASFNLLCNTLFLQGLN